MRDNSVKSRIRNGEITMGSWVTIGHPSVVEIMAHESFDWLTVDMEHNLIDPSALRELITAGQLHGKAMFVRVPKNDDVYIKHALDAGADGIIVPMVSTIEDARNAVNHCYYPPKGTRGVGLSRAQGYGKKFEEYKRWVDDNLTIIVQLEHYKAIENLRDIAAVEEIDAFMIGPYDLSASLGFPGKFDLPIVKESIDKFRETCIEKDLSMGLHIVPIEPKRIDKAIEEQFSFIAFGTDFQFMNDSMMNALDSRSIK